MKTIFFRRSTLIAGLGCLAMLPAAARAQDKPGTKDRAAGLSGEALYRKLSRLSKATGPETGLFDRLTGASRSIDWKKAKARTLTGNLRRFRMENAKTFRDFYLVRDISGEIYILFLPKDSGALKKGSGTPYADLACKLGNKMEFKVLTSSQVVGETRYRFARLTNPPERLLLDRLFYITIVVLLFLTMVGMGLTLTVQDFALVFKKPTGMLVGIACQFGLLPLVALAIGRLAGFYDAYPFIFLGMILISASPGGVTSNLMTYLGKGDVALSVSLTAVCTVLSLVATPLLLTLYVANIPDFNVPAGEVFKQILILVIVPLFVGMAIRWKAEKVAKKAEKVFAGIGVLALLFLMVVGVLGNLEKFADTNRYGFKFYLVVFVLTFAGMFLSGLIAKIFRLANFQIRAIALECGLRNASLAMTIAILLQDRIGDFYSSMFFTSGIFGLWMYVAGALTIYLFKKWLPVDPKTAEVESKEEPATGPKQE